MLQVSPISFKGNESSKRITQEQREDIRDTAVAGGAAGAGYTAAKGGGLNMAKKLKNASSVSSKVTGDLNSGLKTINESRKAVTGVAGEASGLFKSFKLNAKKYSDNIINSLKSMKCGKFVQRMINTPVVKAGCKAFGGILAVCVLLSGLGTLYNNTSKVVDNYAPKLAENLNAIADHCKTKKEDE